MRPVKNYEQKMRRVLKKIKLMVKKYGSLGILVGIGALAGNCGIEPIPVLYGPPPVTQECYTDEDCFAKHGNNWYCDLNEASPVCRCAPVALYGPQPCTSDEECRTKNGGADWYCDTANTYDNGCGETASWPLCKQMPCAPVMLYGPPMCTSDEECQSQNGSTNWYCDKTNAYNDGCGGTVTWPVCKTKDVVVPLYGCLAVDS